MSAFDFVRQQLAAHLRADTDPCGVDYPCDVAQAITGAEQQRRTPALQHRGQAELAREALMAWRRPFKVVEHPTFIESLVLKVLDDLREDLEAIINGVCPYRPGSRLGQPIGMHHCPRCGCMVIAGVDLHPHDYGCWYGLNHDD